MTVAKHGIKLLVEKYLEFEKSYSKKKIMYRSYMMVRNVLLEIISNDGKQED